jgi:2-haloacid dehalogenase
MAIPQVDALVFDVFGTVVDWRTSVADEGRKLGKSKGITADWEAFADAWRGKYQPFMSKVRGGELPWTKLDVLHRMGLDEVLTELGITSLTEDEKIDLNRAWHRLHPWSDSVPGLYRLKAKFILGTMSNGNIALMTNMAKFAGLPWDCILGAEVAKAYKPDPKTYLTGAELLDLPPERVMMVAAHQNDLLAAQKVGLKTAFVPRPLERGAGNSPDLTPDPSFDVVATDFVDLASQMGA